MLSQLTFSYATVLPSLMQKNHFSPECWEREWTQAQNIQGDELGDMRCWAYIETCIQSRCGTLCRRLADKKPPPIWHVDAQRKLPGAPRITLLLSIFLPALVLASAIFFGPEHLNLRFVFAYWHAAQCDTSGFYLQGNSGFCIVTIHCATFISRGSSS